MAMPKEEITEEITYEIVFINYRGFRVVMSVDLEEYWGGQDEQKRNV